MNVDRQAFVLSQTDGRPMYLQIMEQVQQRVAVDDWQPGEKLPSIRELAVQLEVSVITVKRAYLELERMGVIVTQHGKGSWIAEGVDHADKRRTDLARHVEQVVALAGALGLGREDLVELIDEGLRRHPEVRQGLEKAR